MSKPVRGFAFTALATLSALIVWGYLNSWHANAAIRALRTAGHGEFVTVRARTSSCPAHYASTAFISNGRRHGPETAGYVCTRRSHRAIIREQPLKPTDDLDWH